MFIFQELELFVFLNRYDCSVGPECKIKTKFELTREMKTSILNVHNVYRNKVAMGEATGKNGVNLPQGADLVEMVWDDELAYFAQCYANKCILQYDKCRQSSAKENIEQIIFIKIAVNPKTTDEIIMEMIESAFYSSKHLSEEEIEMHRNNKLTEQFTQLFWSRTSRVGCGLTRLLEDLYAYFMVCNYGPAGNIQGERVYKIGTPCSSCPDHRICDKRYTGLCAVVGEERNGLESIPAFLTTLERVVDPRLQKNESAINTGNDTSKVSLTNTTDRVKIKSINFSNQNRNTSGDERDKNKSEKSTNAPKIREIPIRICEVNKKLGGQDFEKYNGKTSSAESQENIYVCLVILSLLYHLSIFYNT
ncbi:hypothetical protein WA026_004995 [Henosepilachna vigintioctopunctata]|uniref:SCP domain-containing protein n=1 Tax=Henosepilachna vigintioctopunctata TaxID=420089 RepID=A0AAW1UVQ3_9CUCU